MVDFYTALVLGSSTTKILEDSRGTKYKCRLKVYHKNRKRVVCTKTKRRTKAAMTLEDLKANKAQDNQHKELAPKYYIYISIVEYVFYIYI